MEVLGFEKELGVKRQTQGGDIRGRETSRGIRCVLACMRVSLCVCTRTRTCVQWDMRLDR